MLRPVTMSSASASSAPVVVHASAAADFSASETRASAVVAADSARAEQGGANRAQEMFRYNSFEFIYRQDIGRIVLIGQSPETGERVIQVPSEQALQAYERTARVEQQMERIQGNRETSQQAGAPQAAPQPTTPQPTTPQPAPQLAKALVAAVSGANHGSGVVSVSA
jgi:hypothetical protein